MRALGLLTDELRIGLCPDRLVIGFFGRRLRRNEVHTAIVPVSGGDPLLALQDLLRESKFERARLTLILSNRYVRYAVLPWAAALGSEEEWKEYARLHIGRIYGHVATEWHLVLSGLRKRQPRVICAVDEELRRALGNVQAMTRAAKLVSAQPYLMAAFNARRRILPTHSAWFVVQEPKYLTLGLRVGGVWTSIRRRQYQGPWFEALPAILDRESAQLADARDCDRVLLWAEDENDTPARLGRYSISDLSAAPGREMNARPFAMVSAG